MKNLLTSALVLKIADPEKDVVVCTDACGQGLGGFLMQDNHVICYESREIPMAWGTTRDSLTSEINLSQYAIEIKCLTLKD